MNQSHNGLRVVILGDYPLDPSQIRGGVQAVLAYLAKGLSQIEDLQVHVICMRQPGDTGPGKIEQNNITVHLLSPFPPFERLRNYRTYQRNLNAKLAEIRPDLLHAQDATAHSYVALRTGYPTVVTAHGVRCEDGKFYSSIGRRLRNYFDSWIVERYIMSHVRYLITTGHYVADYFAHILRPDIQVRYIWNAVDDSFFNLEAPPDHQSILYAGRVIPRKHVLDLVEAFAQIAPQFPLAHLRIVGECKTEPAYVQSIQDKIHQFSLGERIHLIGAVPDITLEFANCNLLVLPSAEETSPMVIAQAMAASKPIVATRVGTVAEMLGDGSRGLLVGVGDIKGLAEALLCLLRDPALQVSLGQAGRSFAEQNHRINMVAQQTYRVYQEILADQRKTNA